MSQSYQGKVRERQYNPPLLGYFFSEDELRDPRLRESDYFVNKMIMRNIIVSNLREQQSSGVNL